MHYTTTMYLPTPSTNQTQCVSKDAFVSERFSYILLLWSRIHMLTLWWRDVADEHVSVAAQYQVYTLWRLRRAAVFFFMSWKLDWRVCLKSEMEKSPGVSQGARKDVKTHKLTSILHTYGKHLCTSIPHNDVLKRVGKFVMCLLLCTYTLML